MTPQNAPKWTKNIPGNIEHAPGDCESYIIAVKVFNRKTRKSYWQIDQVQAIWYDDGLVLLQGDDPYTDWNWEDVDYYMKSETPIEKISKTRGKI